MFDKVLNTPLKVLENIRVFAKIEMKKFQNIGAYRNFKHGGYLCSAFL